MSAIYTGRLKLVPLTAYDLSIGLENKTLMDEHLGLIKTGIPLSDVVRRAYQLKLYRMIQDKKNWLFHTFWQIILIDKNCAIGAVGFNGPASLNGELEVGYYIDEPFQCNGYMTEALIALIDWAFTHSEVLYVKARTACDNYPSQRVLQKAGLQLYLKENFYWWVLKKS